jgi:hypothetical protein
VVKGSFVFAAELPEANRKFKSINALRQNFIIILYLDWQKKLEVTLSLSKGDYRSRLKSPFDKLGVTSLPSAGLGL